MNISRLRARPIAAAAIAVFAAGALAVPARAAFDVSTTFGTSIPLPPVKGMSVRVATAPVVFTPSVETGRLDLQVTAGGAGVGAVYTSTDFECAPGGDPNPILQVWAAGPRSSAHVVAGIDIVSRFVDGAPVVWEQTIDSNTVVVSTLSDTLLLELCGQ